MILRSTTGNCHNGKIETRCLQETRPDPILLIHDLIAHETYRTFKASKWYLIYADFFDSLKTSNGVNCCLLLKAFFI